MTYQMNQFMYESLILTIGTKDLDQGPHLPKLTHKGALCQVLDRQLSLPVGTIKDITVVPDKIPLHERLKP